MLARMQSRPAEPVAAAFPLELPEGVSYPDLPAIPEAAPSPDGRNVAFVAKSPGGRTALWVRPLSATTAHRLEQTEGADIPFWSPDGQSIAFFADGKLKRVPAGGGPPQTLADAPRPSILGGAGGGGTWSASGTIVFSPGDGEALLRVAATGGPVTPAMAADASAGEVAYTWPQFLPDGRHLLYFARNRDPEKSGIYVQELGSARRVLVLRNRLRAAWAPPGFLLYPRDDTLFAQRIDTGSWKVSGEPVMVAEEVNINQPAGRAAFAVSASGVLVYRRGRYPRSVQLAWWDRNGKRLGPVGKPGQYQAVRLSPDGKNVAVRIGPFGRSDSWIMDVASGASTRVGSSQASSSAPAWSPDSQKLAVVQLPGPRVLFFDIGRGKVGEAAATGFAADDWSKDGRFLAGGTAGGVALLPVEGGEPRVVTGGPNGRSLRIAPGGDFVAYVSE